MDPRYGSAPNRYQYIHPEQSPSTAAVNSIQDAQRLLSDNPFASAVPITHGAHYINHLSVPTNPPSYIQPQYYSPSRHSYQQGHFQRDGEYASEIHHLQAHLAPENDGGYWQSTRDDAVRLLSDSGAPAYMHYPSQSRYTSNGASLPTYQTNAFAQSVFQRIAPATAYPTPPPPEPFFSSSSLAGALIERPPRPRQTVYYPQESSHSFESFIAKHTSTIGADLNQRTFAATSSTLEPNIVVQPISGPSRHTSSYQNIHEYDIPQTAGKPRSQPRSLHSSNDALSTLPAATPKRLRQKEPSPYSPDPLALGPGSMAATPRKRKPENQLDSPSVKRPHGTTGSSVAMSSGSSSSALAREFDEKAAITPTGPSNKWLAKTPSTSGSRKVMYVELPPLRKSAPVIQSQRKSGAAIGDREAVMNVRDEDINEEDLGGFGSEYDHQFESPSRSVTGTVKSSARKTGERDMRQPLEKLVMLFEDVFEAEDSLPPDASAEDLPAGFFSGLSIDQNQPILHSSILRKLSKYISQVARPSKRMRLVSARDPSGGTPRAIGRMAEVDSSILGRMLKLLDRSVKAGEDLDPFKIDDTGPATGGDKTRKSASPSKKGRPKKVSAEAKINDDPQLDDAERSGEPAQSPTDGLLAEVSEADIAQLTISLELAKDSVLAAECCLALLASDRLPKQLYSEELIMTCLGVIKNHLAKIVYPFIEASSASLLTPCLRHIVKPSSYSASMAKGHRKQLLEVFQALSSAVPRIGAMVNADAMAMSEAIVIQAVYIAIGPFFVVEGEMDVKGKKENVVFSTLGSSATRSLRLDALSLIRSIFANHEDQRSWIIEEILTSLIKLSDSKQKTGQFRLRDGRSIRTVSALLLQLVQTSAHDVRVEAQRLCKVREQKYALRRQESLASVNDPADDPLLDDQDFEEIRLYGSALESATKAAKTIVLFLTQRSGKTKTTKNSNEAEYRAIFDHLISDLMVVLFWPEWPAASLLLGVICRFMVASLDDVKSTTTNDNNAAKSIALDHLGVIAARLKACALKFSSKDGDDSRWPLLPLEEILAHRGEIELDALATAHHDVFAHLCKRASEDQASESARELSAATWGQQIAHALKRINAALDAEPDDTKSNISREKAEQFVPKLKSILRNVWKEPTSDVFDVGSQDEAARVERLAEEIASMQGLRSMFGPILNVVLVALDAPPVFMRTKALRALGQILSSDPTTLSAPNVRIAIENHLLDSSPAVRDAAVELIGKYMIDSPEVARSYYRKIADRIADTGLGVRKRVIKLLRAYYDLADDNNKRVDICTKIVLRMYDEDDGVKDIAIKALEDMWFYNPTTAMASRGSRGNAGAPNPHDKTELLGKVAVIMGVCTNFKDRQSPLEDMLYKIMAEKSESDAIQLFQRYTQICETLIDGLVDDSDITGFTIVNAIRTIHLFTVAHPAVLSGSNASTLLPYVKNASTADEQVTAEYLLKIFRASVPHMPKTAAKFGHDLQVALQPMILKPQTGLGGLQESVACMCSVVQELTHDHGLLVGLLKSCNARLQQVVKKPNAHMSEVELRASSMLIFIVSLLAEHYDFDRLRQEQPSLATDVDSVSQGSIVDHIYDSLLDLHEKYDDPVFKRRILHCLGFLFRARPTLMTVDSSAAVMDAIFQSPDEEDRGRLLTIVQEFLLSQVSRLVEKQKDDKGQTKGKAVNMDELIGNAEGFADSGVSLAVVQRYIVPILKAALSQNSQIQTAAVDILSFTVRQGLAHPMQCFPTIVALATSPNLNLSNRANALHGILHNKHTTVLNARHLLGFTESFEYQKKLVGGLALQGYRMPGPTALLHRWYTLVREKRAQRQDFLRATLKAFEIKPDMQSSLDDVQYIRYVAENFSAFDYKTQEEVLTVIKHLTSVLSTTGTQLVDKVSPSNLLEQLVGGSQSMDINGQDSLDPGLLEERLSLMRSTVIAAMVMLLKAHLKALFGLPEEKCSKWVQGKKSAIGDKPAVRKHERPISWDRLPFATAPMLTSEDAEAQKMRFLEIWNEDGITAEPDDDTI